MEKLANLDYLLLSWFPVMNNPQRNSIYHKERYMSPTHSLLDNMTEFSFSAAIAAAV
jgi:hypothetical protein